MFVKGLKMEKEMRNNRSCLSDNRIVSLADNLKTLSDPNRLRIVCLLLKGEMCACEVEADLKISQQLTSHHLTVLKEAEILKCKKEGTSSIYSVNKTKMEFIKEMIDCVFGLGNTKQKGNR